MENLKWPEVVKDLKLCGVFGGEKAVDFIPPIDQIPLIGYHRDHLEAFEKIVLSCIVRKMNYKADFEDFSTYFKLITYQRVGIYWQK